MPVIEIRDALPSEYDEVGEVTAFGYKAHSFPEYEATLRDVATRAKSADIIVATLDGVIVGAAAYVHKGGAYEDIAFGPTEAEFRMLTVSDGARGHGIGEALSRECIQRATADGRTHVVISVAPDNHPAERIYSRLGFVRDPARDWVAEDGFALRCWELDLRHVHCGWCGQGIGGSAHATCGSDLEPERYCRACGRRMVVQILPTGSETKPCVCTRVTS